MKYDRPMERKAWLFVLTTAACATTAPRDTAPTGGIEAVDSRGATRQAREVIEEGLGSLRRGDVDGLQSLLASDVFVVPPGTRVFTARSDVVVALVDAFAPRRRHRVTPQGLQVASSPGGRAAWAAGRIDVDGVPYPVTAVLAESDGLWTVMALHLGPPYRSPNLGPGPLPGGVDAAAEGVARLFREGASAPDKFSAQLADRNDAVVLGPSPRDMTRGAKAIQRLWRRRPGGRPTAVPESPMRASVTSDGTLAWVAANVSPQRYFTVYERTAEGWRLVAMHASLPARGRRR